jgi:hypothetical protein
VPRPAVDATAGLDANDTSPDAAAAADRLQGHHGFCRVIEGDECELVPRAQVFHHPSRGFLGLVQGIPVHGPAAVQHQAEGQRPLPFGIDFSGTELDGELNGLGRVGENDLMTEKG